MYQIRMYLVSAGRYLYVRTLCFRFCFPFLFQHGTICLFVSGWWYAWYLRTLRPWTHTSDDRYIYQLSLVVATATVSLILSINSDHGWRTINRLWPWLNARTTNWLVGTTRATILYLVYTLYLSYNLYTYTAVAGVNIRSGRFAEIATMNYGKFSSGCHLIRTCRESSY